MSEHINFRRGYRADLVFPPWEGCLRWALPLSMAAPESERR